MSLFGLFGIVNWGWGWGNNAGSWGWRDWDHRDRGSHGRDRGNDGRGDTPAAPVEPAPVDPAPVNAAPTLILDTEDAVCINPLGSACFDVVDALDADGDELVFSLSGDDADLFEIDPETGEITLLSGAKFYETVAALKAETEDDDAANAFGQSVAAAAKGSSASDIVSHAGQSYDLVVTVTDSEGASDSAELTVDVMSLF